MFIYIVYKVKYVNFEVCLNTHVRIQGGEGEGKEDKENKEGKKEENEKEEKKEKGKMGMEPHLRGRRPTKPSTGFRKRGA